MLVTACLGTGLTFYDLVVASFDSHIRHADKLELGRLVLVSEVLSQPSHLLHIAHCTADMVSASEELIGNVAPNETIDSSYKDGGALVECESGHSE